MKAIAVALISLAVLACAPVRINSQERRLVKMTLVPNASSTGAYCLDGSSPAYHLDRGFGAGANHWLLQFEGGGWCNNLKSCFDTAATRRGSTRFMSKIKVFNGILSNNASFNPDFYNWNRVKLRYCDGASFAGDATFRNATSSSLLYFRGQRIWKAIILHLLPKGLAKAKKALLSGCSAGGLATFLHCDNFTNYLPMNASVKCLSDSGFFLDATDIAMNHSFRYFYKGVVDLQGVVNNLNKNCTDSFYDIPEQCFFPQYALPYIKTPFFILNSAYDAFQLNHILVPSSADPNGSWSRCKLNRSDCNAVQINTMQGFRKYMLDTLRPFYENSTRGGMYISSSFTHGQSENQDTWFAPNSTRVHNKTIAKAVGDWYFGRNVSKEIDCAYPFGRNVSKEIDCAYPCDSSCHNQ